MRIFVGRTPSAARALHGPLPDGVREAAPRQDDQAADVGAGPNPETCWASAPLRPAPLQRHAPLAPGALAEPRPSMRGTIPQRFKA